MLKLKADTVSNIMLSSKVMAHNVSNIMLSSKLKANNVTVKPKLINTACHELKLMADTVSYLIKAKFLN